MENIRVLLEEYLNKDFVSATASGSRKKSKESSGGQAAEIKKVKVRPLVKKGSLFFQLEEHRGNQVFHKNLTAPEAAKAIGIYMEGFRQLQIETVAESVTVLVGKKGTTTVKRKAKATAGAGQAKFKDGTDQANATAGVGQKKANATAGQSETAPVMMQASFGHNRVKNYILKEGIPVPFLVDLGVMTQEGKVVQARYDKFRQINRFLEFVADIVPDLPKGREITILDFGCGKSYLTFAIYYYLHELLQRDVRIIGLDLKDEVIRNCNKLAEKYGYESLKFLTGDIADYTGVDSVDMVVTLHACDTATDYALAKAIGWNAKVILSVPCCQHELNGQIKSELLEPVLKYGIIKERMAVLITDGLRGQYLEREGYKTQLLEFIDMAHTPKNILIRAVKRTGLAEKQRRAQIEEEITQLEEALGADLTLGRLLS